MFAFLLDYLFEDIMLISQFDQYLSILIDKYSKVFLFIL